MITCSSGRKEQERCSHPTKTLLYKHHYFSIPLQCFQMQKMYFSRRKNTFKRLKQSLKKTTLWLVCGLAKWLETKGSWYEPWNKATGDSKSQEKKAVMKTTDCWRMSYCERLYIFKGTWSKTCSFPGPLKESLMQWCNLRRTSIEKLHLMSSWWHYRKKVRGFPKSASFIPWG